MIFSTYRKFPCILVMIFLIFEFFHAQIQLDCHEQQLLVRAVINMEKKN